MIQFFASASVAKSLTCISGRSGNVIMTSHPGPPFTGRVSNLISTDSRRFASCIGFPTGTGGVGGAVQLLNAF